MSFGSPLFLLALLVVPLALVLAIVADRRKARFPVTFTNLGVLAGIAPARRHVWKRVIPTALLALALVFTAGALAHPRVHLSQPDQNATIVLLVDVSGSMRANDVEPTRLDAAVNAMRTFLDRLPKQFKVGLVAFSSEPEPLISPDVEPRQPARVDLTARAGGRHGCRRRDRRGGQDASPPRCARRAMSASPVRRRPGRSSCSPTAPRTAASCSRSRLRSWPRTPAFASTRCRSAPRTAR